MTRWRGATADDAGAIAALAAELLGDYAEAPAVYAQRIALCPAGCLVLEGEGDGIVGHLISHPWPRGGVPELHAMVDALPAGADAWYIHDVCVAVPARGDGAVAIGIDRIATVAREAGLAWMTLVGVDGADGYWRRLGFHPTDAAVPYGCYMERSLA